MLQQHLSPNILTDRVTSIFKVENANLAPKDIFRICVTTADGYVEVYDFNRRANSG